MGTADSWADPYVPSDRRPPRRLPRLSVVAAWWETHAEATFPSLWRLLAGDLEVPVCFACGEHRYATWDRSGLDRGHLVDRSLSGLDTPANLIPICLWCHRIQPSTPDIASAVAWVEVRAQRCLGLLEDDWSRRGLLAWAMHYLDDPLRFEDEYPRCDWPVWFPVSYGRRAVIAVAHKDAIPEPTEAELAVYQAWLAARLARAAVAS